MNTKQIQFNRQRVAALLLAGSILAAIAGLAWADVSIGQPKGEAGSEKAGAVEYDSGLSSEFHLRAVKAGKMGGSADGWDPYR
jgi:hypothetical protein